MTLHEAYQKVLRSFGHDVHKTMKWFNETLVFGGRTPNQMIALKKQKQVIDYIKKHFIY